MTQEEAMKIADKMVETLFIDNLKFGAVEIRLFDKHGNVCGIWTRDGIKETTLWVLNQIKEESKYVDSQSENQEQQTKQSDKL